MMTTYPQPVKLWGRGQLTIPKELRDALHLEDDSQLTVFAVGRCLILTPKRLVRSSLAKDIERAMKAKHLGFDDLLATLKEERARYNRETYGV